MVAKEMSEAEKGTPVGGIILLFFGVLLLMQTTGYLPWSLWDTLWRSWPVLIIIAGINLLFRRLNPWLLSLIIAAVLTACVFYAYYLTAGTGLRETIAIIRSIAIS